MKDINRREFLMSGAGIVATSSLYPFLKINNNKPNLDEQKIVELIKNPSGRYSFGPTKSNNMGIRIPDLEKDIVFRETEDLYVILSELSSKIFRFTSVPCNRIICNSLLLSKIFTQATAGFSPNLNLFHSELRSNPKHRVAIRKENVTSCKNKFNYLGIINNRWELYENNAYRSVVPINSIILTQQNMFKSYEIILDWYKLFEIFNNEVK